MPRSYLNWANPLVVVEKLDGRIRSTCNYKNIDGQSIFYVLSLPVVCDLLSELGNSRAFTTTDLVSGYSNAPSIRIQFLSPQYVPKMDCGNGQ